MLAPELAVPPSEPRFVSWYVALPPFSPEALRAVPASTASATSNKVSRRFTNDLLDVVFCQRPHLDRHQTSTTPTTRAHAGFGRRRRRSILVRQARRTTGCQSSSGLDIGCGS